MSNDGWMGKEPNSSDIRDRLDEAVEEAKSTPPSREFVQKQIDHLYSPSKNVFNMDKLAAALQGLLELVEADKAKKSSGWIAASEPPEHSKDVLVCDVNSTMFGESYSVGFHGLNGWNSYSEMWNETGVRNVTHWMPLPGLPKP